MGCLPDYSVFIKSALRGCVVLIVYMDNIVLSGCDGSGIEEI